MGRPIQGVESGHLRLKATGSQRLAAACPILVSFKTPKPIIRLRAPRLTSRTRPLLVTNLFVLCPIWSLAVTILWNDSD